MSKPFHYSDLTDEQKSRVVLPPYWTAILYENGVPKLDDRGQIMTEITPITIRGMSQHEIAEAQVRWFERRVKP